MWSGVLRRLLCCFALLFATPLVADCIGNGHYTAVASTQPLAGTPYPYTEDLTHRTGDLPFGDPMSVAYRDDLGWTKVQSGCAEYGEKNIHASTEVNLLLRASFHITHPTSPKASATRFEAQLRVGRSIGDPSPIIAATSMRRIGGQSPQSFRFGGTVANLPAGSYVYSLWVRLLDRPPSGDMSIGLQWITAQGVPASYATGSEREDADIDLTAAWTGVGRELTVETTTPLDLAMVASMTYRGGSGRTVILGWSLDGDDPGDRTTSLAVPRTLPASETTFDHRAAIAAGRHTLRLLARSQSGAIRIAEVTSSFTGFPQQLRTAQTIGLQEAMATTPLVATTAGSAEQPVSMSPVCGRWTKILDLNMESSDGTPSWSLSGYVELLGADEGGYGMIGVQAVHDEPDPRFPKTAIVAATDMGMFEFQYDPVHSGISFYGDCSKWGNAGVGNHLSLWIRRIEGCDDTPFGGTITVGRRWLAVKLLPSRGPHL